MPFSQIIAGIISPILAGIRNFILGLGTYGELILPGLALALGYLYFRYLAQKQSKTIQIVGVTILVYLLLILS